MITRVIICILSLGFIGLLPNLVNAADENMDSAVYLTFDPATGQFTSATKTPEERAAEAALEQTQSLPAPAPTQGGTAAVTMEQQPAVPAAETSSSSISLLWTGGVIALVLIGLMFIMVRKGQQKTAV